MAVVGQLIVELISDAKKYEDGLNQATGITQGWAGKVSNIAGTALTAGVGAVALGAVAAVGAVGKAAFDVSSDTREAANQMAASLGVPIDKAEEFADVARNVYGNNFADSVLDAADTVEILAKQIDGLANDSNGLQRATENAYRLQDVFDAEIPASIDAVDALMDNFGVTSDQAFDLIARGYQRGLNSQGDFLETITEYSTQFSNGGASAEQFFNLVESGAANGVLGTDKAADAFKEFIVRIQDGSTATASGLDALGLSSETMLAQMADGTLTGADAFQMVVEALNNTDDANVRMQAGVALLGTQFEDLGASSALGLSLAGDGFQNVSGAVDGLNVKYESFSAFAVGMWRRTAVAVSPLTDKLLELVNDSVPHLEKAFDSFERNVIPVIETVEKALDGLVEFIRKMFTGSEFAKGIGGNVAILNTFKEWFDKNLPLIQQTVDKVMSAIDALWARYGSSIITIATNTFSTISIIVDTTLKTILDTITLTLQIINGDWEAAGETLKGIVTRIYDAIRDIFNNQLDSIKEILRAGMDTLVSIVDAIRDRMYAAGRGVVSNLQNGISARWDALVDWFKGKLQGLTDLLPFSPPRDSSSPLVRLPQAGRGIVEQIQSGIDSLSLNVNSLAPVIATPTLANVSSVNSSPTYNVNVTNHYNGIREPRRVTGLTQQSIISALSRTGDR